MILIGFQIAIGFVLSILFLALLCKLAEKVFNFFTGRV
jgi:hypothetical protein